MATTIPASVAISLALLASGCSSGSDPALAQPDPAPPSSTTTTTSTAPPPTTIPATTSAAPSPTTTTSTTTTTSLPTTLEVDGSPMIEFSVEVDPDLGGQLTQDELLAFVIATLGDERSWPARGVGFRLVDEGGLFTVTVATPDRVDDLCHPLQTNGRFSCGRNGWVAINSDRWFGATDSWPGDLETYRRYLINHEVGHYLLGPNHEGCPGIGQPAPVMMQQTKGLGGCEPNGWVEPEGAEDS